MKRLPRDRVGSNAIEQHQHICDLVAVEHVALSLYSDGRRNWLYLWCDTDGRYRNRWIVFPTTREGLVHYLDRKSTLRALLLSAQRLYLLQQTEPSESTKQTLDRAGGDIRRSIYVTDLDYVAEYLPSEDSFFDPDLTGDLDLSQQLVPSRYSIPIDGDWYSQDFQSLFKRYERLYAFFYATGERFFRTLRPILGSQLLAPWTGGFSRINLYSSLAKSIPGLHALRILTLQYASPGTVDFEAIPSVGDAIAKSTLALLDQQDVIDSICKSVNRLLRDARLAKQDLSQLPDSKIDIEQTTLVEIRAHCELLNKALGIEGQASVLQSLCPNTVVYAKALLSLIRQLDKLAEFQRQGLLRLSAS